MRCRLSSLSKILLSLALILLAHLPLQTLGFRVSASVKGEHRKLGQNNQPGVYDLEKSMKTEKAAFIRLASVAPRLAQTRAALPAPSLIGINPSIQARARSPPGNPSSPRTNPMSALLQF